MKKYNFISRTITATELFMQSLEQLEDLNDASISAGLDFVDADFIEPYDYLTASDFDSLQYTISQLRTLITSGHLTNLNKARS